MQIKQPNEVDVIPNGAIMTERNRYFTGKYMTARDFRADQDYFLSHHHLHNRLMHGWGVVCGLKVGLHPNKDCEKEWVVIQPGIALDSYGHELILPERTAFKLPPRPAPPVEDTLSDTPPSATEGRPGGRADEDNEAGPESFLICLRYLETEIEPVPALYSEGSYDATHYEANRVREGVCIEIKHPDEVDDDCWLSVGGGSEARCHDDCDEEEPGPAGTCLEPDNPCGGTVPLALITYDDSDIGFKIDLEGRRELRRAAHLLTQIVDINWPHGGEMTLEELRALWDPENEEYRLTIRFDRKLLLAPDDSTAYGINEHTFIIQYAGAQRDREFLAGEAKLDENDPYQAVFAIDPRHLRGGRDNIENYMIYVTLKCDFIRDCHGNPVDGNHLRGRLPSGNGIPGGTFESWFFVTPESED